jgi:hypothetical protein
MQILNNKPNYVVGGASESYLGVIEARVPEIKKEIFQAYMFTKEDLTLLQMTVGLDSVYAPRLGGQRTDFQENIGSKQLSWRVVPNYSNTTRFVAYQSGYGSVTANNTAITMTVTDAWLQPSYMLRVPVAGGAYQILSILSGPVANSSNWDYQVKLISKNSADVFLTPVDGTSTYISWLGNGAGTSDSYSPQTSTQPYDWYANFMVYYKESITIERDELETKTWYANEGNTDAYWVTFREDQWRYKNYRNLELMMWNGVASYQSVSSNVWQYNTPYLTSASGATISTGDGVIGQVSGGNVVTMSVATISQQVNYNATLNQWKNSILKWGVSTGVTKNTKLMVYTGTYGFSLAQDILKDYVDKSGGGVSLKVKNFADNTEVTLDTDVYKFAGYELHFMKTKIFDNPELNPNWTSSGSSIPLASYQMFIMPLTGITGRPTIETYFRGGVGLGSGFVENFTPGLLDPTKEDMISTLNVSNVDGYTRMFWTEFMTNVNVPTDVLFFSTTR